MNRLLMLIFTVDSKHLLTLYYMLYKSEVIHGINSTYELKFYQSALTQRKYTVCCISAMTIQQYNTLPHSKQVVHTENCTKCIVLFEIHIFTFCRIYYSD